MDNFNRTGQAGTLESNDILVTVVLTAVGTGIEIALASPVEKQFGNQIRSVIKEVLHEAGVADAVVSANDRGALDCTLRARMEVAIARAQQKEDYDA